MKVYPKSIEFKWWFVVNSACSFSQSVYSLLVPWVLSCSIKPRSKNIKDLETRSKIIIELHHGA